jgi:hypothetical protein
LWNKEGRVERRSYVPARIVAFAKSKPCFGAN